MVYYRYLQCVFLSQLVLAPVSTSFSHTVLRIRPLALTESCIMLYHHGQSGEDRTASPSLCLSVLEKQGCITQGTGRSL